MSEVAVFSHKDTRVLERRFKLGAPLLKDGMKILAEKIQCWI